MRKALLLILALAAAWTVAAQPPKTSRRPDKTVLLYASSAPGLQDPVQAAFVPAGFKPAFDNGLRDAETYNDWGDIRNISKYARFDLFLPRQCNGGLVIVLPGGGYSYVSAYNEGIYAAEWLVRRGYAAAVLKYRLPNGHWQVPLEDVHKAMQYCRTHAAEWGVRKIGIMGGSAGGHLAAMASNIYDSDSERPDFAVLLYPVTSLKAGMTHGGSMKNLTGADPVLMEKLSMDECISAATPPTFLALSDNDNVVNPCNSTIYYDKLKAFRIPAEVHIFASGGHGWGFYTSEYGKDRLGESNRYLFLYALEAFLKNQMN